MGRCGVERFKQRLRPSLSPGYATPFSHGSLAENVTVQGGAPETPVEPAATEWEVAALGLMAQGPAADAAGIHGPSPNSWRNACSRLTPCLAAVDR